MNDAVTSQQVLSFFKKFSAKSKDIWNGFFRLDVTRRDVRTTATSFAIPFILPSSPVIADYLKGNVEDEWHWENWALNIGFVSSGDTKTTPHIRFEAGATPHVNRLGGNEITMDENQPVTEYGSQWTIRHEFGHVIGFPDCYIEFYDTKAKIIVAYQLDITNLMCSRRGHLKQTHRDELKKIYGN